MENANRNACRSIRQFHESDEAKVVGVWHRSGKAVYTFLPAWQTLTIEKAHLIFRSEIRAKYDIWVGKLDEQIIAYVAMKGSYIDRLYVDPSEWRTGWGTQLINFAKQLSPQGLELHTHQENHAACALYEHHDFEPVKFGLSPPPESAPDVEYHWRP